MKTEFRMAADNKERYPKNSPGPFFVINGECITCLAPEHQAPDLMGFDKENNHCFFKKQPSTPEELDRAQKAVMVSCCDAVQYGGDDPAVKHRMGTLGVEMIEEAQKKKSRRFWQRWFFD